MANDFTHLHLHTKYSLNDAMIDARSLAKRCKEFGMNACAITEHGHLLNMPEAYLAFKDEGIKLIVGMEAYVSSTSRLKKDERGSHLVLLCENNEGYSNLLKIASDAAINGYYYNPRTDKEMLRKHGKGLIASSACLGGSTNRFLLAGDYEKAKEEALEFRDIFGKGNFFLEIQRHGLKEQEDINPLIIKLSKETGIPLIATNDSHYLNPEDWEAHDIQMAIQAKTTITDTKRKIYTSHEFYFKSGEQMYELFKDIPEACENTVRIADRCHVEIDFKSSKLPPFKLPDNYTKTNTEFLTEVTFDGLRELLGELNEEQIQRAEFEISVVERMGFVNYFLITWDVFRFCKDGTYEIGGKIPDEWKPILVGPGRGCMKPGTRVYLYNGSVKNIEDVVSGDIVVGEDGPNKVYTTFEYDIKEEITSIHVSGETIELTNDHKMLVLKTQKCKNEMCKNTYYKMDCRDYKVCSCVKHQKLEWVEASKIEKGDFLCLPKKIIKSDKNKTIDLTQYLGEPNSMFFWDDEFIYAQDGNGTILEKLIRHIPADDNLGEFIGAYIGNGWSRFITHDDDHNFSIGIAMNASTQSHLGEFIRWYVESITGKAISNKIKINKRGTCSQLTYRHRILSVIIKNMIGTRANNKHIPNELLTNNNCTIGLLKGLFGADGHIPEEKHSKITYSTTSDILLHQVRMLLSKIDVFGDIVIRKRKLKLHWNTEFKIGVSGKQACKLYDALGVSYPDGLIHKSESIIEDDKYLYKRVSSVDTTRYAGKVYDLGVESSPSYNVSGYVAHNSGAGSLMLYGLGITKIDPLKHDLLFQRFLNPDRISMPDIDSDFESSRRQEVIDYVVYKYGRESICQIITFGTLAARASIRRVGKALDYPIALYDKVSKMIPVEVGITISKALLMNQDLHDLYISDKRITKIIDFAMKLEGLPTNQSTHAAGVLITDEKGVTAHVPMTKNESGIVAQFDKDILEKMGLLKMDFLALKTLGVLGHAKRMIEANHDTKIDFDKLYEITDLKPLQLIRDGHTECLFQVSGAGMTGFLKELQPDNIEDIILGISIYRPGPMDSIPQLLHNKRNPDRIVYRHPKLEPMLKPTYGILTYQEQCMQIVTDIAGYSKGDSDVFRKIISKKILSEMPLHRKWFVDGRGEEDYDGYGKLRKMTPIDGAVKNGVPRDVAEAIFDDMIDFAKYAFNKSHAAAYAYLCYVTAWFMYYYPVEFMAANLTSVIGIKPKVARYVNYCSRVLNIEILPPKINEGTETFVALPDGKIVYTLMVKGAAIADIQAIVSERDTGGAYTDLLDFINRTKNFIGKKTYEGLIGSGALSGFGVVKSRHLAALDDFWDGPLKKTKDAFKRAEKSGKPYDFYSELVAKIPDNLLPEIDEFPKDVELRLEKELLGVYLSGNPLFKYAYSMKTLSNFELSSLEFEIDEATGAIIIPDISIRDRQKVTFIGILNDVMEIVTKNKQLMARLEIEDLTSTESGLCWASSYQNMKNNLIKNEVYLFRGYIMLNPDEPPTLVIDSADEMTSVVIDRVVIEIDSPLEAREILIAIKSDKFMGGSSPTYIASGHTELLLPKEYWTNSKYITDNLNKKIQIKVW